MTEKNFAWLFISCRGTRFFFRDYVISRSVVVQLLSGFGDGLVAYNDD